MTSDSIRCVLGLLVCVFMVSFCCRAADAVGNRGNSAATNLPGTWNFVYTPTPDPQTPFTIPPPDNITLTFSAGMTNPTNGAVLGTMTGQLRGVPIHNGNWAVPADMPIIVSYSSCLTFLGGKRRTENSEGHHADTEGV